MSMLKMRISIFISCYVPAQKCMLLSMVAWTLAYPWTRFLRLVVLEMSTALRSAKYRAREAIRNSTGKQVFLHGENYFAREGLRKQDSDPKHVAAFAKAKRGASCRTRFQKFGRGRTSCVQEEICEKQTSPLHFYLKLQKLVLSHVQK